MRSIRKLLLNTRGATAIEYALVASLISIAAITAFRSLGTNMETTFNNVSEKVAR